MVALDSAQLIRQHYHPQLTAFFGQPMATTSQFSVTSHRCGTHSGYRCWRLLQNQDDHQTIIDDIKALTPSGVQLLELDVTLPFALVLFFDDAASAVRAASACPEWQTLPEQLPSLAVPGLLVMDMDSTAITIECIDEIAAAYGVGDAVATVTAAAMRGELDFNASLKQRVAKLAGCPMTIIKQLKQQLPLMPGLSQLVAVLQQAQWKVAIASGGFMPFVNALKQQLQLDNVYANQLAVSDDGLTLTGDIVGEIVNAQVKADSLLRWAELHDIALSQTVAIGDGANDLLMLNQAALGVAFHAKPKVREQAKVAINDGSLAQLLLLLMIDGAPNKRS